jgi:5'-phosphate synthase pdxT subunit
VSPLVVGVLASQGDFAAHARMLESLGADAREVRAPGDFEGLDALVIPGGESTTIAKAIERDGLEPAIREHVDAGRPVFGTCAGLIMSDSEHLGLIDATARRNAFGRQRQSFERDIVIEGLGTEPLRGVFIRAEVDGHPVVARQDGVLVCAFHPELTDDSRLHALFMAMVTAARDQVGERA